jgi:two-component sensor histidine kinase/ActR/RegA family two-component response regulator
MRVQPVTIKVLLIDDDEDDYVFVRNLLADIPNAVCRLEWVADYDTALVAMERDEHDVCLLDYRLEGRNGLELMREAMSRGVKIPFVFLTGHGNLELDLEAMKAGAADYLCKVELNAHLLDHSMRYAMQHGRKEEELQARVEERTTELVRANTELEREVRERKEAEQALRDSLKEKVALLKEVHHRVKNNLQIVASLLNLQANRTQNPQVANVLLDTRNRVGSMALLHETLYSSGNLARINFHAYVEALSRQLLSSFGPAAAHVSVQSQAARIGLPLEHSVPCGLIINELVSNCLKHAFPDERAGKVKVVVRAIEGQRLLLSVSDDGVGLPSGLDPADTSTLGLQLVSNLAQQLGGRWTVEQPDGVGVAFSVVFPMPEATMIEGES